ncbi:Double-stranded RNA-specific editase Adar [Pseudolycoriella hygida]|uniref:Double-stranded RNA-specific editase Adar n=1 Tax=Pseudolycoriella hygida TaxID=35572 RepID=A0A9Q0NF88_9DIPT|nr:Double-stranded RNA-specific editase Adar [Pseudolycoriella hygida]KAJ6649110.1 Double-stranded RNA-specific editase Adar [Pseudolycoriella hygida]
MTKGMSVNDAKVVAISSGTKCYSNKYEDKNGTVLHDMHSEVLARRSFIRFLYTELTAMADGKASIFFVNGNEIQLKADLKFHLYVNAIPCGDARVFSLNGCVNLKRTVLFRALRTKQINEIDIPSEPFTAKQGALRTKRIDGTHILSENKTQRVTSMSCSDKILRWNTLGLQGAALTKIIKPIYLESIVLGSHYVPIHLHRAIYGRLNDCVNIPKLPDGYRLNQPRFESTFVMEIKNFAIQDRGICWSVGFEPEMLNLNTGLNTSGDMSRVSKAFILSLSQLLNERLSNRFNDTGISKYNAAKDIFYETLKKNYGNWGNTN